MHTQPSLVMYPYDFWVTITIMQLLCIVYCKSFEVEKFCGFCRLIGNHKCFSVKYVACAVGLGHARLPSNRECFPVNHSLVLQPQNYSTSNDCNIWYHHHDYNYCIAQNFGEENFNVLILSSQIVNIWPVKFLRHYSIW